MKRIKANELRVGNLITRSVFPDTFCVVNWGIIKDLELHEKNNYTPILLTPEILKKCRFKVDCFGEYTLTDNLYFNLNGEVYYSYWEGSDDRGGTEKGVISNIKTLHQLQNLYFALTGEELIINL